MTEEGMSMSGRTEYMPPTKREAISEYTERPIREYPFNTYVNTHAEKRYTAI